MAVRAVLWDVDDTLFDYSGSDRSGALAHIEAEGLLCEYGPAERALARWQAVMERQFARFLSGELSFREHRRERARAFLGSPLDDEEADAWFARYVARYESAWRLFPDAVPALDALAPAYRHGALSNAATANQDRKLRRLGIRDRFEVLLCADELGCAKPAPEAFAAGCAALGLPPGEVAYVGDRRDTDARAADEAGLCGVWLDRRGTAVRGDGDGDGDGDGAGTDVHRGRPAVHGGGIAAHGAGGRAVPAGAAPVSAAGSGAEPHGVRRIGALSELAALLKTV